MPIFEVTQDSLTLVDTTSFEIGRAGFSINYGIRQQDNNVHVWIANDKAAFHSLHAQKEGIEAEFGQQLSWDENPDQLGSSISFRQQGGYRSPPDEWPVIQERMVEAMINLNRAFRARVQGLPK